MNRKAPFVEILSDEEIFMLRDTEEVIGKKAEIVSKKIRKGRMAKERRKERAHIPKSKLLDELTEKTLGTKKNKWNWTPNIIKANTKKEMPYWKLEQI